jgi:hypothetical protein
MIGAGEKRGKYVKVSLNSDALDASARSDFSMITGATVAQRLQCTM